MTAVPSLDRRLALVLAAATVAALALTTLAPAAGAAGGSRAPALRECRGQHIDGTAPVISRGDVFVAAPARLVYKLQTDVDNWATWRPDVTSAYRLDSGRLRAGSSFRWETAGLTIVSTVAAVRVDRCTVWGGPASGIDGIHYWGYRSVPGGTLVHTEESWSGAPVEADPAAAQAGLDAGLAAWRSDLKKTAEASACGRP